MDSEIAWVFLGVFEPFRVLETRDVLFPGGLETSKYGALEMFSKTSQLGSRSKDIGTVGVYVSLMWWVCGQAVLEVRRIVPLCTQQRDGWIICMCELKCPGCIVQVIYKGIGSPSHQKTICQYDRVALLNSRLQSV